MIDTELGRIVGEFPSGDQPHESNYSRDYHASVGTVFTPHWSTNSGDGKRCFASVSGDDRVSVISYRTGKEVARIAVGDHPDGSDPPLLRAVDLTRGG